MKKFYDRQAELAELAKIEEQSRESACFTVLMGRRRVGKTELLKQFAGGRKVVYLFTSRNSEGMLCSQWQKTLESELGIKVFGSITNLADLFRQIMDLSRTEHFTVIIDEFQDINSINSAFFSQMQDIWDSCRESSKINLIVCGSVYSLMTKIFEGQKEPLFGRCTNKLNIGPFKPSVLKQILQDYNPGYTNEDLLCLYMFSGGVAKYVSLLMDAGAVTKKDMFDYVFGITSPFLFDGKEVLISEIGKDYGIYFSILQLISGGFTTQSEIDSVIQKNTGAYLHNLENVFGVIKPVKPLFSKPQSRNVRWQIVDEYMRFYFRYIFANQSMIELGQHRMLEELALGDYETFTGKTLERYFSAKIKEESRITALGGWWDRKSGNEIDIIALNSMDRICKIYEVKRQRKKIDMAQLEDKSGVFCRNIPGYKIELAGLCIEDM